MNFAISIAGWVGAIVILAAYGLLSAGRFEGRMRSYHLLNIGGAAGIALNSGWNGAMPSAVLNVIWIGIGIYALLSGEKKKAAQQ